MNSQSHLHPSFHPVIYLPPLTHPLFTSPSMLPSSHPKANHWSLTTSSSIRPILSSNSQSLITYYIFTNPSHPIIHSLTTPSLFPSSHPSANRSPTHSHLHPSIYALSYLLAKHWPPTTPSSKHPSVMHQPNNHALTTFSSILSSCHPLANHSPTHYILFPSSILSSNRQTLIFSLYLYLSFPSQLSHPLSNYWPLTTLHPFLHPVIEQLNNHPLTISSSILPSSQPLFNHWHTLTS